ncbi:hypothetical protein N656DRAFT_803045 [Canariomyces notabilis]|uniref:Uncharacterized protein n=1 Tax=Canariomyces notabilis TaxID=2074819 RepID=A0AAN6QGW5_9PEZI|nr:hypothetical protein N656DRAFT_803045 [Canariomyces arenarius]
MPLHIHAAIGREITVVDRMDLHLWTREGKLLVKPIPRFLDPAVSRETSGVPTTLPLLEDLSRETPVNARARPGCGPSALSAHRAPSFRINIIHYFTRLPPFEPYLCGRHSYGSLFRDNLTSMAAATTSLWC